MAREIASRDGVYRLSGEERAAVRAGMNDARNGDFALDEEIDRIVIPGREHSERTRNLEIPGSMLRIAPE
jgi:predicted transcriptional regulator